MKSQENGQSIICAALNEIDELTHYENHSLVERRCSTRGIHTMRVHAADSILMLHLLILA